MKIHTVLPNKRQQHDPEPFVLFHRSTEVIRNAKGEITKVNSHTYEKPETIARKKAFVAHVHQYTQDRLAAEMAKMARRISP